MYAIGLFVLGIVLVWLALLASIHVLDARFQYRITHQGKVSWLSGPCSRKEMVESIHLILPHGREAVVKYHTGSELLVWPGHPERTRFMAGPKHCTVCDDRGQKEGCSGCGRQGLSIAV